MYECVCVCVCAAHIVYRQNAKFNLDNEFSNERKQWMGGIGLDCFFYGSSTASSCLVAREYILISEN
jgi:hypothetical protein